MTGAPPGAANSATGWSLMVSVMASPRRSTASRLTAPPVRMASLWVTSRITPKFPLCTS